MGLSRVATGLVILAGPVSTNGQSVSNTPPERILLLDPFGHAVEVPTNALPADLLPPSRVGLENQFPDLLEGTQVPEEIQRRHEAAEKRLFGFQFFPEVQPRLMPYLASVDDFGNTALKPGPLFATDLAEPLVQQPKYWLSEYGLRYKLEQNLTFLTMSDVMQGDQSQGFYSLDLKSKWNLFDARDPGTAGWISSQIEVKSGLGANGTSQDPKLNLGTLTSPNSSWSSVNGIRVPELAWQQSLNDGRVVVLAGVVSQRNYIDRNAYAQSARTQFMNSGLVRSQVMPLSRYNFGMNLQCQPVHDWYAMAGASAGNAQAGDSPWTDFSWDSWSLVGEVGYAPDSFFGMGPGVYRIQPFVAETGGPTQGGLCFNFQQQLGERGPFGWFGRFGFGGNAVTAGASAQIGTGFVAKGPLAAAGLFPSRQYDFAGIGFVWSQPSTTTQTVFHENEYTMEAGYVLQLTPTIKLQPDIQVVWNAAFNQDPGPAVVFQLQLDFVW